MIKTDKLVEATLKSFWYFPPVAGDRTNITLVGVFSDDGRTTHSPTELNWEVVDGVLSVNFGTAKVSGYLIYSYDDGNEEPPTPKEPNIIINNNNICGGTVPEAATF